MLVSFAHHYDNPPIGAGPRRADDYRALSDYLGGVTVMKMVNGTRVRLERNPVPELLHGRANLLRRQIASLTFQCKYRVGLLSFAPEDIDVAAFNAGDPRARRDVDLALGLYFEALWPGIPTTARPMPYITTHTHTGRLEVNVALPRAIYSGSKVYSYNPDPPVRRGEAPIFWKAFQDLVNHTFGWADPDDPARRRDVTIPHWKMKLAAEGARAGLTSSRDSRDEAMDAVRKAAQDERARSRHDVIEVLETHLGPKGMTVLSTTNQSITIGEPGAPVRDRMRLKGRFFAADFDGSDAVLDSEALRQAKAERAQALAEAPVRFQAVWAKRANWNRERYGHGLWPAPNWSVAAWLHQSRTAAPSLIPGRHHLLRLQPTIPEPETEPDDHFDPGSTLTRPDGPDRAGATGEDLGSRAAARRGRGPERRPDATGERVGADERTRVEGLVELERHAREISGPIGVAAIIGHLVHRLKDLTARASTLLFASVLDAAITPERIDRFFHLATRLEALNARHHAHPESYGGFDEGDLYPAPGHRLSGGPSAGDRRGSLEARKGAGRGSRSDRDRAGYPGQAASESAEGLAAASHGVSTPRAGNENVRPAAAGGRGKARDPGEGGDGVGSASPGDGLNRLPLGALLRFGRGLARHPRMTEKGPVLLKRIEGGFLLTAPGVRLALLEDRLRVHQWIHPKKDLSNACATLSRALGVTLPIKDARQRKRPPETQHAQTPASPPGPIIEDIPAPGLENATGDDPAEDPQPPPPENDDADLSP